MMIKYETEDNYNFFAYYKNSFKVKGKKSVGWIQVGHMILEDDEATGLVWLQHIAVNSDYQKQGIGSNLIQRAVNKHGNDFRVPLLAGALGNHYRYYFSGPEGVALTQSCIRNWILHNIHCNTMPPVDIDSDEDDNSNGYLGNCDIESPASSDDYVEGEEDSVKSEQSEEVLESKKSSLASSKSSSHQVLSRNSSSMFSITDEEMADSPFGQACKKSIAKSKKH